MPLRDSHTKTVAAEGEPRRIDVGGFMLNSLLLPVDTTADLPPILFVHGASTSLSDPCFAFADLLRGRASLLFVDRPGHGQSDRGGPQNILPDGQADAIAELLRQRGIDKAILVGHSYGGAVVAAFAVRHPDAVAGLVFLSPAAYPWPGGIEWYYRAACLPVIGALFSALVVPVLGRLVMDRATKAVFAPNARPADYVKRTKALQSLRPKAFRHNAREIAALHEWTKRASAGYRSIKAPTVIITGDTDTIVWPDIHSKQLARDISGSKLLVVRNLGHKPDCVATDLAIKAIEDVAGFEVDLQAAVRAVEQRIAVDGID